MVIFGSKEETTEAKIVATTISQYVTFCGRNNFNYFNPILPDIFRFCDCNHL